jgi:hypothetical protein
MAGKLNTFCTTTKFPSKISTDHIATIYISEI